MIPGMFAAGARGAAEWTPAALSPLVWLDDSTDVTDAGGGTCSQWNDKSGNGWHFSQPDSEGRPLIIPSGVNGRRALRFDGSSDWLACVDARPIYSDTTAGWAFFVYRKRSEDISNENRYLWSVASGSDNARFNMRAGTSDSGGANARALGVRRLDSQDGAVLGGGDVTSLEWESRLDQMDWGSATGSMYVNGALDASGTLLAPGSTSNTVSSTSAPVAIGASKFASSASSFIDADIACVIAGAGSLPDSEGRDELFNWAAVRFGL